MAMASASTGLRYYLLLEIAPLQHEMRGKILARGASVVLLGSRMIGGCARILVRSLGPAVLSILHPIAENHPLGWIGICGILVLCAFI